MDLRDGAVLAAASAPRFDPNVFLSGDDAARQTLLHRPDSPLLDRVVQMALPPGSVFKTLTAVALLESATVDPQQVFTCRGYLHDPGQMRCEIYIRQGIGHGPVTLADALARSCNVYFFHYAGRMGPAPLEDWARRLGFGQPTGVDLPGEAAGTLPTPQSIRRLEGHGWRTADTQRMAVGQGSLTATPLQVLRLMAAVATGKLLTPHVASLAAERADSAPSEPGGLSPRIPGTTGDCPNFRWAKTGLSPLAESQSKVCTPPRWPRCARVFSAWSPIPRGRPTARCGWIRWRSRARRARPRPARAAAITPGSPAMCPPMRRSWPSSLSWSTPATCRGRRPGGQAAGAPHERVGDVLRVLGGGDSARYNGRMTTTSERKAFLRRVQTALQGVFGDRLRGVVLYGSEARGTARPDSDIDSLVLLAGPVDLATDLVAVHEVLYPIALELGRRISAKPVDAEQYESIECPLYNAVHREGLPA